MFIILVWTFKITITSVLIVLPTSIGRAVFSLLALPLTHDLYTFGVSGVRLTCSRATLTIVLPKQQIGCYVIWGSLTTAM